MSEFANVLRYKRKENNLNQKELAAILGVKQTAISNYESGRREPSYEVMRKICDYFEISMDRLMGIPDPTLNAKTLKSSDLDTMKDDLLELLLDNREDDALKKVIGYEYDDEHMILFFEKVLKPLLYEVGIMWANGRITVAREHYISHVVLKILHSITANRHKKPGETTALCMTYASEFHTIGIRIIEEYLRILGFRTIYIGGNTPTSSVLEIIKENQVELVAISVTMDYHMKGVEDFVSVIRQDKKIKPLNIILGGQGVEVSDDELTNIGVQGVAEDFSTLAHLIQNLYKNRTY